MQPRLWINTQAVLYMMGVARYKRLIATENIMERAATPYLPRFIIGFGWQSDAEIIDAPSLEDAKRIARDRSMAAGVDAEALDDCAWAHPYDEGLAFDLGLLDPTEPEYDPDLYT